MKNKNTFRKGQIAIGTVNTVLVTGPGNKTLHYPVFAGVVIMAKHPETGNDAWPVGMYSDAWSAEAFTHTDLKMNKIMHAALNQQPDEK